MRFSTKVLLIIGLRATQILGRIAPPSSGFEIRAREDPSAGSSMNDIDKGDDDDDNNNDDEEDDDKPPPPGFDPFDDPETDITGTEVLIPPAINDTTEIDWFNLDNSIELSEMPDRKDWVIPVSHAWCATWDIKDVNVRGSIQRTIRWNNRGNKVHRKYVHWELDGQVGTYVCDCKWEYRDKATSWEMWEFYERMIEWCGEGRAGWIFSKKWEKGYAVTTRDRIMYTRPRKSLCPKFCCFDPKSQKLMGED
ncbi:uncharacterized protein GGS22DRAFT_169884 [Annulohypoxylon maeteangense]|uniref:uncharacterized protein n=1 Tax=Annulohypoxylon maeteangense TaxID=1927788 RepID=UPI002008276D|nr:uncharacterized protein GGS22DRAFT_169884 [Annulohypoxylon maeteangense]KAI0882614.1 hypothetical protein GGS22DRAFT_169884 [Annulohypoxylon maeteangense]